MVSGSGYESLGTAYVWASRATTKPENVRGTERMVVAARGSTATARGLVFAVFKCEVCKERRKH
jgi:hypothetical protein